MVTEWIIERIWVFFLWKDFKDLSLPMSLNVYYFFPQFILFSLFYFICWTFHSRISAFLNVWIILFDNRISKQVAVIFKKDSKDTFYKQNV